MRGCCQAGAPDLPRLLTNTVRLNDRAADDETHDEAEKELESSRSRWIKLGGPIWRDALREFPLRGVSGAVALPGTRKDVLIKFEDAGEPIEAALAVDECLRLLLTRRPRRPVFLSRYRCRLS